jgi:hypothetical protein
MVPADPRRRELRRPPAGGLRVVFHHCSPPAALSNGGHLVFAKDGGIVLSIVLSPSSALSKILSPLWLPVYIVLIESSLLMAHPLLMAHSLQKYRQQYQK